MDPLSFGSLALVTLGLAAVPRDTGYVPGPDGVRLYYETVGSGPTVLIVPGRLFLARHLAPLAARHTLILYDMRNRGRSSPVTDGSLLTIWKDVEDLEAVRRYHRIEKFTLVGYSYLGLMAVLYTREHPDRVERLIQLGPVPQRLDSDYPPSLLHRDSVPVPDSAAMARLDLLERSEWARRHPREFCEESRRVRELRLVGNPAKARLLMNPCDMPNEWPPNLTRHFRHHFSSVQKLVLSRDAIARVRIPVLIIHGTWDRNAPYAGGREWALTLPDARLITIEGVAHQLSAEAPEIVLPAIETFVSGRWPAQAERVRSLGRGDSR